jgi:hypothetical protein
VAARGSSPRRRAALLLSPILLLPLPAFAYWAASAIVEEQRARHPREPRQPNVDQRYTICVLDHAGGQDAAELHATAPAGGVCAGRPCWASMSPGYTYRDKDLTPEGLQTLMLRTGDAGKATFTAKGKSTNLPMPALPLTTPVKVRLLRKDAPVCWDATYSSPLTNDGTQFKANSD